MQRFAKTLAEAGDSVASLINETLSGTLAVEDLDAVTEKLRNTTSPRVDLQDLADSVGDAASDHSIDTDYLLRLIDLSNRINASHHQLVAGEHGLGRARYGLAVAGGSTAAWAGAFPHNPFQAPVLIDMSGDAAQLSAGLIEGHLDETTELIRLLRLARLEVDQPDGADWKREALASLRWQDLSADEVALCPPLILIGSDEMLAGQGLSQLIWLLNSGLPVKVLVLSALDFGLLDEPTNNPRGKSRPARPGAAQRVCRADLRRRLRTPWREHAAGAWPRRPCPGPGICTQPGAARFCPTADARAGAARHQLAAHCHCSATTPMPRACSGRELLWTATLKMASRAYRWLTGRWDRSALHRSFADPGG